MRSALHHGITCADTCCSYDQDSSSRALPPIMGHSASAGNIVDRRCVALDGFPRVERGKLEIRPPQSRSAGHITSCVDGVGVSGFTADCNSGLQHLSQPIPADETTRAGTSRRSTQAHNRQHHKREGSCPHASPDVGEVKGLKASMELIPMEDERQTKDAKDVGKLTRERHTGARRGAYTPDRHSKQYNKSPSGRVAAKLDLIRADAEAQESLAIKVEMWKEQKSKAMDGRNFLLENMNASVMPPEAVMEHRRQVENTH